MSNFSSFIQPSPVLHALVQFLLTGDANLSLEPLIFINPVRLEENPVGRVVQVVDHHATCGGHCAGIGAAELSDLDVFSFEGLSLGYLDIVPTTRVSHSGHAKSRKKDHAEVLAAVASEEVLVEGVGFVVAGAVVLGSDIHARDGGVKDNVLNRHELG